MKFYKNCEKIKYDQQKKFYEYLIITFKAVRGIQFICDDIPDIYIN